MGALPVSEDLATSLAASLLHDAWIVGIEYWRTSWGITFAIAEDRASSIALLKHPFELMLSASSIQVSNAEAWSPCGNAAPIDLVARSDCHDALAALLLFNSVAYRALGAQVRSGGELLLAFEGGRELLVSGAEWSIAAKFAESGPALLFCEAGSLHASSAALQSSL